MIKDISFNGVTQSPSDHVCTDGDLATCLNLLPEDGVLKPIGQGIPTGETLSEGEEIIYVHKAVDENIYVHYIIRTDGNRWYFRNKGEAENHEISIPEDFIVNSVTAVGNILCFVGDKKTLYNYWQSGTYTLYDLENLSLKLEIRQNHEADLFVHDFITFDNEQDWLDYFEYRKIMAAPIFMDIQAVKADMTTDLINLLRSKCEKLSNGSGHAYMPFVTFLVGAVKLYDGTYISYTPIYVLDSTQTYVWVEGENKGDEGKMQKAGIKFKHFRTIGEDLYKPYPAKSIGIEVSTGMSEYRVVAFLPENYPADLIESVDIFITRYDDLLNTDIQWGTKTELKHVFTDAYLISGDIKYEYIYGDNLYKHIEALPFYRSLSIPNSEIYKEHVVRKVTGTELAIGLAQTHNINTGGAAAVTYNNRLHIIRPKESLQVKDFQSASIRFDTEKDPEESEFVIVLKNKKNEQHVLISKDSSWQFTYYGFNIPLNDYSDVYIYSYIKNDLNGPQYYKKTLPLISSEVIEYSLYFQLDPSEGFSHIDIFSDSCTQEEYEAVKRQAESNNNVLSFSPSLIKVSEAENPLIFPAKNSVLVGSSVVKALASNTRPITEGQFGDAPLYAFTDEGTWMLMTSQEGTYSARQPVNRDVCSNPNGILQTDDAVLFPTERGIMMQQGNRSELITDPLDGYEFNFLQMYKEDIQRKIIDVNGTPASDITYIPFRQFMKGADMAYDYYGGHVIVFNPEQTYAYVYSMKSKMWGIMHSDIKKRMNIYPGSYAINENNQIVDLYQDRLSADTPYFLCTRPFGFDDAEAFKTIYAQITRGHFRKGKGKCGMALYGSNDMFRWYLISTSADKYLREMCGTPYKYFRLALVGYLSPDESLSGFSTEFKTRWNNKLR